MIKVFIADDHAVVRSGLKRILAETTDMVVSGEARNGIEILHQVQRNPCDVLLLDLSMPGKDGMEVLRELKQERPKLPVLVLSVYPEDQYAIQTLKAGASGYLNKECATDQLVTAIRKVATGGKYISAPIAEKLPYELQISDVPLHACLSRREYQVMCAIASGKSPTEIAEELKLSVKTIGTYRNRILEKMRMKNNAQLTHYAIKFGLMD
jgi:two-component system, NarL family, invasion response regulator UvrY